MIGDLVAKPGATVFNGGPVPGGGGEGSIYLGVLFALGATMIFWAFARRAKAWQIASISAAAVILTQVATPGPAGTGVLYPPLVRMTLIPGHTNAWVVFYPVIPWLGVTGLGVLFGKLLRQDTSRARHVAAWAGLALLLLFALVRTIGGFGNLNVVPAGWMGFLNVVKYPPSLSFLTLTLSVNLLLMAAWLRLSPRLQRLYEPLVLFGRTALFFYLAHLYVYSLLGSLFRTGCSLPVMCGVWLAGLAILYPLCRWYNLFKRLRPPTSPWRFF
jgi:uncharacterized membrane protein